MNYKLLNISVFAFIIYLIYTTREFWIKVVSLLWQMLLPFFIAFALAYAISPIVNKLKNNGIPKGLAIVLVIGFILLLFGFMVYLTIPILFSQIGDIYDGVLSFFKEISLKYNIEFSTISDEISSVYENFIDNITKYISDGMIDIIGVSIGIVSKIFIVFALTIYFLIDMDKIKKSIHDLFKYNKKTYNYLRKLDEALNKYLSGFIIIIFISFFEYTIIYFIIGHPNYLLLGFLAALGNLIPYFGGIITNAIAMITAFVISPKLFIRTVITFLIFSSIDGYLINPLVYGKSNKLHPIIIIGSIFIFGILFGIWGIVLALPMSIVLLVTFSYFKDDIIKFVFKGYKR